MATDENNHKNEARDDWTGCTFRVERGPSSEGRAWGMADILTDVPRRVWPARPGILPRRPARDRARPRRRLTAPAQAFAGHAEDHWINVVTSRAGGAFAEVRRPPAPREPARRAARGRCESARARARAPENSLRARRRRPRFARAPRDDLVRPTRSSGRRASKATSWACGPGAAMIDCGSDFVIRAGPRGDLLRVVSASAPGPVRPSDGLYLRFSTQERHRGLLPRRGHESGLPLARGLERLVAGGLAARRVLFSASTFCLLDLFMRSAIESGAAPRL